MEITLAKIEAAEADVARLEAEERRMRTAAQADGTIDPQEQADLDRILGKIGRGREVVTRLRREYEANKAIWDGKATDLARLKAQTAELQAWGEPAASALAARTQQAEASAGGEQWKAATAALDTALNDILEPYAEYLRQSAAKAAYDPDRAAYDARLAAASATELRTPGVVAGLKAVAGNGAGMDKATAARDFVAAQDLLTQSSAQLAKVEADISTLEGERTAYLSARGDLNARLAQLGDPGFTKLKKRGAGLTAQVGAIDKQVAAFDFAGAMAATTAALTEAEALHLEAETMRLARDGYEALQSGLEARLDAARAEGVPELAPKLDAVGARIKATKSLAEAEDFGAASAGLEEAATEMGGLEDLLADRKLYLERLDATMPDIVDRGVSTEHNGFLSDLLTRMADAQTRMEAAAKALDFKTALVELDEIVVVIGEIDAAIEARHQEYETERAIQLGRIEAADAKPYPEVAPRTQALLTDLATADSEVAAEHFDTAMEDLAAVATELDLLEQDIEKIETELKEKIKKLIDPILAKMPGLEEPASPSLPKVKALVKSAQDKAASGTDLPTALKDAEEATKQVAELEKVHAIMKRVEDKFSFNQDDEARDIVTALSESELQSLPMEARNYLVEKMLSGVVSKEDHAAIQKMWSQEKFVDRKYDELDAPKRETIVKAFKNDPKVKDYQARWASMTEDEKKEAVKYMTTIPAGKSGWNVGEPAIFEFFDEPKLIPKPGGAPGEMVKNPKFLYGSYGSGSDKMKINLHADATEADLIELMDTIAHEIGHKEQAALIKGYDDGSIPPGDPRYDQAKSLKLCEEYRKEHNKEFKEVYSTSPEEAHSRKMGDELSTDLRSGSGGSGHSHGP